MTKKGLIIGVMIASVFTTQRVFTTEKGQNDQGLINPSKGFSFANNEIIVALLLRKNLPLSDGIIAYAKGNDIALPLEQLMFLLEFPIKVTNNGSLAKGWYIRDTNNFSLDLNTGKVVSNGKVFQVSKSDVLIVENELYVPAKLLSKWFPIDFKANLRALDVIITPREAIAIDDRIDRKNKKFGTTFQLKSTKPERQTPYKAFTIPALNVNFGVGYHSGDKSKTSSTFSVRAYSDFAFMSSQLYLAGSDKKLSDARILLSRRDPRGRLLGRLDATAIEVGDISTRTIPLVPSSSLSGRGFRIARRPAEYASGLEKITLEGFVETGYDVELYRNGILINAIQSNPTNRYKFENLKLFGGQNEFKIEFYGKQGQRRTEVKQYYVGAGQVKTGELLYDISVYQADRTVFGVRNSLNDDLFKSNKLNVNASVDYGVSTNLSFTVGMSTRHEDKNNAAGTYGFGGIRTRIGNYSINVDTAIRDSGGYALGLSASTRYKKIDYTAKYESYIAGFLKGKTNDTYLTSRASIDMNVRPVRFGKSLYVGFGVGLNSALNNKGDRNYQLDNQLSMRFKQTNFTNSLRYSYSPNTNSKALSGTSNLNISFRKFRGGSLRLVADYDVSPDRKLNNISATISKTFKNAYTTSLQYSRDYINESKQISASISKAFKPVSLSLSVLRQSKDDTAKDTNAVFLTMSLNTFTDLKSRKTYFSNQSNRNLSGVRANVFLDENNNGIFDRNEKSVKGAKVLGFGKRGVHRTNKRGQALLLGGSNSRWQDVYLDTDSLSDPSWRAGSNGFAVLPRGGRVTELNFPVIVTADIEGKVILAKENGVKKPLGNITIQAVRKNLFTGKREVVTQAVTAYDGFYSMPGVPLGNIELRVDPGQVSRLAIVKGASKKLYINSKTKLYSDESFTLIRK